MNFTTLDRITKPEDLRKLDIRELEVLCAEIRAFLIDNVSKTGGHLSSNLGVIELTVALHRGLHSPQDAILFDVGHQCYTHKLLTGRRGGFAGLRQAGGLSGFPCPAESPHDPVVAGHGSASVSAAVGLARAKKLRGDAGLVVAVVGDGAFAGGMVYEALNNVEYLDNLVIVLNDNNMSISKSVGALAQYLNRLRTSPEYYKAKSDVKSLLDSTPVIGGGVKKSIQSVKMALRKGLYHSTFFEEIGLRYVGPLNGHDLPALCGVFSSIRQQHKPLLLHVETTKGKGFVPAEKNPGAFHGVSSFDARQISDPDISPSNSFSTVFGKALARLADADGRVCAVTAAMKYGTGLQFMKKSHRDRFFDVGMAEEHAVTFAAGLAAGGLVPVVAVYSTFLQRAYDQIIHDVMLARRNVVFAVDRAGLVPGDGETHQGIYDAAFLTQHPDMIVVSPANYAETTYWLKELVQNADTPRAVRYPRGEEPARLAQKPCTGAQYDKLAASGGAKAAIVTYGVETAQALAAAERLAEEKKAADVFQMVWINPIPPRLVEELLCYRTILFAEEGVAQGGIGEHLALSLLRAGYEGRFIHRGIENNRQDHAGPEELLAANGLDAAALAEILRRPVRRRSRGAKP